jgi:hypothetical protein
MSKPPIKKWRVILTVKEVSTTQKSPVGPKKSHILKALDAAKELDFNGGDDSSSNSSESGTQQSSDEGGLGDDVLEDPDGLQGSGEEDNTDQLLATDSDTDNDSDTPDSPTKRAALTPPPTNKKKRGHKGKNAHILYAYMCSFLTYYYSSPVRGFQDSENHLYCLNSVCGRSQ